MVTLARYTSLCLLLIMYSFTGYTQNNYIDSLKNLLPAQKEDSGKVELLNAITFYYLAYMPDSSARYALQAYDLGVKLNYYHGTLNAQRYLISSLVTLGNYPLAIDFGFKELALAKKKGGPRDVILANVDLAFCYYSVEDYPASLMYDREIAKLASKFYPDSLAFISGNLSAVFEAMNQPDSALVHGKKCYDGLKGWHYLDYNPEIYFIMGNAYAANARYDSALSYYRTGVQIARNVNVIAMEIDIYNRIAKLYMVTGKQDSAIWYAKKILGEKIIGTYPGGMLKAVNTLATIYESKKMPDSALKYLRVAIVLKDSLFNREKTIAIQNLAYKEEEKQKEIAVSKSKLQNEFKIYFFLFILTVAFVAVLILLRNRRQEQLQEMRNSIAEDLHDDIGSTLSSISIMSELARRKSPESLSLLASIEESTMSIQENMSDIVWAVNPKNDRFENILQRMNQFASEILDAKNIALDFSSDAFLSASKLTMEQRKNFYLFFKEVINNAAKYSAAKKVSIAISQKNNHIDMKISDDGRGFDTTRTFDGNGMRSLKKRAAELHAGFVITSYVNKGTTVRLTFKIT